jgi:hypothetical protein
MEGAAPPVCQALSQLPLSVVLHIFSLLPVDCRLRCAEVCRGWRAVVSERSVWTRLDLSATSGVHAPLRYDLNFDSLLRCASARAGGGVQALQVQMHTVTHQALLEVAATNAGALRELHASDDITLGFTPAEAEALCGAAPLLHAFFADLACDETGIQTVRRALRNEAPFGPLRVVRLNAHLNNEDEGGVMAFAADVAAHASLTRLTLHRAPLYTPAALDAVVDAALARRLHAVVLDSCRLTPASAPALARLLGGGATSALRHVALKGDTLLTAPAARELAAALRANSTLTSLSIDSASVFHDPAAAAELLDALTGHVSLRVLSLHDNAMAAAHQAAAGALLGALLAANTPALKQLDVSYCFLGDDGLRPLFEALPANTHLWALFCSGNDSSDAFAADVLLPAVRANASLRMLSAQGGFEPLGPAARDAEALVAGRRGEGNAAG